MGSFTFTIDNPAENVKKVLPPGVLDAVHEVKISETAEVVINPTEGKFMAINMMDCSLLLRQESDTNTHQLLSEKRTD